MQLTYPNPVARVPRAQISLSVDRKCDEKIINERQADNGRE